MRLRKRGKEMKYFRIKMVSAMEKVFADKEPSGEGNLARLTALKGETVSFQIAYYWAGNGKERGKVEVISPIRNQVDVRLVQLVPCEYPCHMSRDEDYLTTAPGLYPDLLIKIPELGFPMVSGQWRSLWIDVEIPEDIQAGEYPLEIRLTHGEDLIGKLEVFCEVIDQVLPKLPVPRTEWFHTDCLADYYQLEVFSDEYWEVVENFVKTAVKRNCNMLLTPVFTPPLDTAVGEKDVRYNLLT